MSDIQTKTRCSTIISSHFVTPDSDHWTLVAADHMIPVLTLAVYNPLNTHQTWLCLNSLFICLCLFSLCSCIMQCSDSGRRPGNVTNHKTITKTICSPAFLDYGKLYPILSHLCLMINGNETLELQKSKR